MYPARFWVGYPVVGVVSGLWLRHLVHQRHPQSAGAWVAILVVAGCYGILGLLVAVVGREGGRSRSASGGAGILGTGAVGSALLLDRFIDQAVASWAFALGMLSCATCFLMAASVFCLSRGVRSEAGNT